MADDKGHKQGSDRIEFCKVPDCKQTEYDSVRKGLSWHSEAHHIACVNEVNIWVAEAIAKGYEKPIEESKWCVNCDDNMIALPLWGTTVLFYTNKFAGVTDIAGVKQALKGSLLKTKTDHPDFENLPQHNYGHSGKSAASSYSEEVGTKLKDELLQISIEKGKHNVTGDDIRGALEGVSSDMRGELKTRGSRPGGTSPGSKGTHDAWMNPGDKWYMPFGMAQDPKPMPYPKMLKKVPRIAEAFWKP